MHLPMFVRTNSFVSLRKIVTCTIAIEHAGTVQNLNFQVEKENKRENCLELLFHLLVFIEVVS